jgi:hypothetical protein
MNPSPGEALQGPFEPVDQITGGSMEFAEDPHDIFGLRVLGERGKSPQVAEHDRDFPPVALQRAVVPR